MKKSLFFVVIATVFMATGCSNDEPGNPEIDASKAIGFKSYVERLTKGTSVASGALKQDFGVYGYWGEVGDEDVSTLDPNFMYNQRIVYSDLGFTYTPLKYWPETGDVDFYAYTPYSSKNLVFDNPTTNTSKGYPVFTYTIDPTVATEEDLLVASSEDMDGLSGNVNFDFDHALTKVGFSARTAGNYAAQGVTVTIKSITLTEILDKGTFSYDKYTNVSDTTQWWTASTVTKKTYVPGISNSSGVAVGYYPNNTYLQLNADDQFLLMIPQDFTGTTATLAVAYEISYTDGTQTQKYTKTVNLDKTIRWTAGVYVNYAFTISLSAVTFTANVSDWRNESQNIIILPTEDE